MKRLLVVANRAPVKVARSNRGIRFTRSEGGLATGLGSLESEYEKHWIGWPGVKTASEEDRKKITADLSGKNIHPVFFSEQEYQGFYEGYSNRTLWPLFHYFIQYSVINESWFTEYEKVNRLFCDKVLEVARPGDLIWVQDYHLLLLPAMLREKLPDASIGFFLHIPFPSHEIFRVLPHRVKLLKGLLGANLIGFHTFEYMRHFINSTTSILGIEHNAAGFVSGSRTVAVDSFPMGINFEQFNKTGADNKVSEFRKQFSEQLGELRMIFSVDRLDYSKGILQRLKGFDLFLSRNPEFQGKVLLFLLVVPSRDTVDNYRALKREIDLAVGEINGRYGQLGWSPIQYAYRSFGFEQLSALYQIADVALVTPLRDGMNLVAKEYVASRQKPDGVLILSEMAGASIELKEAITINPYSNEEIADAILQALSMPQEEQQQRMLKMQSTVERQNVSKWSDQFLKRLDTVNRSEATVNAKQLGETDLQKLTNAFDVSESRLLLLDYDGTLVPFYDDPAKAVPGDALLSMVEGLSRLPGTRVVIISGRDHRSLDKWFGGMPVELIAEHGTFFREEGVWKEQVNPDVSWKDEIRTLLEYYCDKTPGSFIEEKNFSLVWHYRQVNSWLADLRRDQLLSDLIDPLPRLGLQLLRGNKVIELRVKGVDKGTATRHWTGKRSWDFILAAGDDVTDEDIFRNLPENAWSLKVGPLQTAATYTVKGHQQMLGILKHLLQRARKGIQTSHTWKN